MFTFETGQGAMQSASALTYNSSGVDIDENQKANRLIAEIVKGTIGHGVISQPGFFSGAISLGDLLHQNQNQSNLNYYSHSGESLRELQLPTSSSWFACLDYFASTPLKSDSVLKYVNSLAQFCKTHQISILGGETAEMPGVIRKNSSEVITHIFGLGDPTPSQTISIANGFIYRGDSLNLRDLYSNHPDSNLVMSSDGVGTKTVLATKVNNLDCVIGDILGHSQGDIACLGASGIGVCLYLGVHSDDLIGNRNNLIQRVDSICENYGLKLFELRVEIKPEVYEEGQIDLCGTIVGLVNQSDVLIGDRVETGQYCIGIPSSGLHTNGFSLVRRILESTDQAQADNLISDLLIPHQNYAEYVQKLIRTFSSSIKAIAHITGGGLPENLIRVLPENIEACLEWESWAVPLIFQQLQDIGQVPLYDPVNKGMLQTFNMGIGLVVIVDKENYDSVSIFSQNFFNKDCPVIGITQNGNRGVKFNGL